MNLPIFSRTIVYSFPQKERVSSRREFLAEVLMQPFNIFWHLTD